VLQLEAVHYRPVPVLPHRVRANGQQAAEVIGTLIGRELALTAGHIDPDDVVFSMAVTTIMDMPFTSGWITWPDIATAIADHTAHVPSNFTASYECAGWGFALDYAKRRAPQAGYALLTVVDLNILDISFWRGDKNWGSSGFGISTVLLKMPEVAQRNITAKVAKSTQGMGEFCADLRSFMKDSDAGLANVPFLPAEMAGIYDHFLDGARLMPNLHCDWGHCFGSDTWINYIHALNGGLAKPDETHLATSASLRGYWTYTEVALAKTLRWGLREIETPEYAEAV